MFMLVVINAIGIMSWMTLRMLGIENADAWAVAVAQLVERSLPIPEVCGSSPVIGKNLFILNIC